MLVRPSMSCLVGIPYTHHPHITLRSDNRGCYTRSLRHVKAVRATRRQSLPSCQSLSASGLFDSTIYERRNALHVVTDLLVHYYHERETCVL